MATEVLGVSNREEDSMNLEPSMSGITRGVGMIIPPPDIKAIVEKTAQFVARNGIDFENKIREKEINNSRFTFLSSTDPYHTYYRSRVSAFENNETAEIPQEKQQLPEAVKEHVQKAEFVPTHPPPAFEYMSDPSTINAFDLDLMRLTAMFVARNGRQFLTQLMNREVRNFQFDFLKPQHSNFPYFTKLVEQYTRVIIPAKSVVEDLSKSLDFDLIVGDVNYRVAWEKHQKIVKDREDKAAETEKIAYNSIDWHDFVVVQTVDFQPSETLNLPPLCTQKDVGSRILLQQRTEAAKVAAETVEMDMDTDSEEEEEVEPEGQLKDDVPEQQRPTYEVTQPAPAPPQADSALIRDYDPKKARQQNVKKPLPDKYIISPLTNERVSADKLHDHVRYNTMTSQFKAQHENDKAARQDDDAMINASGTEISRNIARLAERRSDIFGVGAQGGEQAMIGKKLGEIEQTGPPRPDPRNIWDGQQSTIEATTRFAQQQAQQERLASAAASAIPPPPPPQNVPSVISSNQDRPIATLGGNLLGMPAPPVDTIAASFANAAPLNEPMELSGFDGPASKRARLEDSLEPEEVWMQQVRGNINLSLATPVASEWNLEGETVGLSINIASTVVDLKNQVQEKTTVPVSKQKLSYEGMFLKDTNTLAYYNMQNGSTIQLQFKERGGRKK